jgi:hypothetical protein
MALVMNFYVDDSGTRKPDRAPTIFDSGQRKHFALGGVLVRESDESVVRKAFGELCARWGITYPLHSVDMRHASGNFKWLKRQSSEYEPFMRHLTAMFRSIPVVGLVCVVDRPGYDARYRVKYGRQQWSLCKTAFSIVVERAAKFARRTGHKLRVLPERCSFDDDNRLLSHYNSLRNNGMPFDAGSSGKYSPLGADELRMSLYELKFKSKTSPLIQIADLYLWPMISERYQPGYRPYWELRGAGRLVECQLEAAELGECGSKYSCFELVDRARGGGP